MREAGIKEKGALKTARLSFFPQEKLKKPDWIRVRAPAADSRFHDNMHSLELFSLYRKNSPVTPTKSGPMVRSSYHADRQAHHAGVE